MAKFRCKRRVRYTRHEAGSGVAVAHTIAVEAGQVDPGLGPYPGLSILGRHIGRSGGRSRENDERETAEDTWHESSGIG